MTTYRHSSSTRLWMSQPSLRCSTSDVCPYSYNWIAGDLEAWPLLWRLVCIVFCKPQSGPMHSLLPRTARGRQAQRWPWTRSLNLNSTPLAFTPFCQLTIQVDLPHIRQDKRYVYLPKDIWQTPDVFIKRKTLLLWSETDVKIYSRMLQNSSFSRPHLKLQRCEEFSWTKSPIAFDESKVLPISYLLCSSVKKADFVMMEDYNNWIHCTWQGLCAIHKTFQIWKSRCALLSKS